jgi:hypothetical protein
MPRHFTIDHRQFDNLHRAEGPPITCPVGQGTVDLSQIEVGLSP